MTNRFNISISDLEYHIENVRKDLMIAVESKSDRVGQIRIYLYNLENQRRDMSNQGNNNE